MVAALAGDKSKLLLSAKRVRRATGAVFIVSLSGNDFSRSSSNYLGKLRYVMSRFVILKEKKKKDLSS